MNGNTNPSSLGAYTMHPSTPEQTSPEIQPRLSNILTTLHKEFLLDHWSLTQKGNVAALFDRSTGHSICIDNDRIFLLIANVETGSTPITLDEHNSTIHNQILWLCREHKVHINKYLSRAIQRAASGDGSSTKSPKRIDDRLLGAAMATTKQDHYHFYQTAREFYKRQLHIEQLYSGTVVLEGESA